MVVKVGINGFGRIGRVIFRTCQEHPVLEVAAINDPAIDVEYICYLMKFDSTHGKFKAKITHTPTEITVDDTKIKIFHEKLPSNVPWQSADVQYVVEASGIFTSLQKASGHLGNESVKRVIVTAPSADVPMVILGVNQGDVHTDKRIISSASSTLYCLAPIVKILNDNFGVSEGFVTSIHAMTPSLKPLDGLCLRGKHWRDHRSIHQNIIPASTGACKALGKIIPQVKDRLVGLAFRVPIVNVSVLDVTIRLNRESSIQDIAKAVEANSKTTMQNIVKISNEEAVSSDFAGDEHSCILDVDSSLQLKKNFFKLVCWYENEYSYACRVIDLILFSEKQFQLPDPRTKMTFVQTITLKKQGQKINEQADDIANNSISTNQPCQPLQIPQELQKKSQHRLVIQNKKDLEKRSRSPARGVIMRNPGSRKPTERNVTKSNEIFRIWNDESEINRQAIQNKIHHSDVEITPQSQISNLRAQLRLENVKKEFSKMVSKTENLLKKCSTIRDVSCPDTVLEEINVKQPNDAETPFAKSHSDRKADNSASAQQHNKPFQDVSGDFVSSIVNMSKNPLSRHNSSFLNVKSKKNFSRDQLNSCKGNDSNDYFNRDCLSCCNDYSLDFNNSNNKLGSCETINARTPSDHFAQQPSNNTKKQSVAKIDVDEKFKVQVVKTVNNLIDNLSPSLQSHVSKNHEDDSDFPKELEDSAYYREIDSDSGFASPVKKNRSQATLSFHENAFTITRVADTAIVTTDVTNANDVKIKGNEIVEYNDEKAKVDSLLPKANDKSADCLTAMSIDSPSSKIEIPQEILINLNKILKDPIIMLSENLKRASSTLSASDNSRIGRKMDLYDKLESASASDSDNSFQIHERKSQVINLTDLTNSIEDLACLDKICRIIEISDELSDKLFSALGNTDNAAIKKAKWSFKDLCQRIKLDEFCNKLFSSQNLSCREQN